MLELGQRQRDRAREIFLRALETTTVAAAVERTICCDGQMLWIDGSEYDLSLYSEVCIVALGKAGATMFGAVNAVLPENLKRSAVVSSPPPTVLMDARAEYFRGGHPEPNADSIAAARAALDLIDQSAPDALVLFLISGGASAMFELPLAGITLSDLILMNRLLIASGASIAEVNCVRKHFSQVKGGRLATHAGAREKVTLLISDVPDTALDALGSGPSLPDTTTVADCLEILGRYALLDRLPASVRAAIDFGLQESPKPDHIAFQRASTHVLLSNSTFLAQAECIARGMGYTVEIDNTCDDMDYKDAAQHLLAKLESLHGPGKKVCLLSGGEVTVQLPDNPGAGGRNLQFCLYAAAGELPAGTTVLSAGTDGIDGNSAAAGAVIDATTRPRGEQINLRIEDHLRTFDAYNYLAPLGYAIATGPTGNNLRDIRILLWEDPAL